MYLAQHQKQQAPCVKNKVKLRGLPKAIRPPDTCQGTIVPTLIPVSYKHTQNKWAYNSWNNKFLCDLLWVLDWYIYLMYLSAWGYIKMYGKNGLVSRDLREILTHKPVCVCQWTTFNETLVSFVIYVTKYVTRSSFSRMGFLWAMGWENISSYCDRGGKVYLLTPLQIWRQWGENTASLLGRPDSFWMETESGWGEG